MLIFLKNIESFNNSLISLLYYNITKEILKNIFFLIFFFFKKLLWTIYLRSEIAKWLAIRPYYNLCKLENFF